MASLAVVTCLREVPALASVDHTGRVAHQLVFSSWWLVFRTDAFNTLVGRLSPLHCITVQPQLGIGRTHTLPTRRILTDLVRRQACAAQMHLYRDDAPQHSTCAR